MIIDRKQFHTFNGLSLSNWQTIGFVFAKVAKCELEPCNSQVTTIAQESHLGMVAETDL